MILRISHHAALIVLLVALGTVVHASDGTTLQPSTPTSITGPNGVCQRLTYLSGLALYIPTTTSTEWQSFLDHPPAGVTLASCSVTAKFKQIFLTSGSSWTVPADWVSANSSVEVIGGGGSGYVGQWLPPWLAQGGGGGGGGAYSVAFDVTLTPGASVPYHVGNSDEDTYFNGASYAQASVAAKAGGAGGGDYHNPYGGTGGQSSAGIGTIRYSGGTACGGGTVNQTVSGTTGGGGGGSAGPYGMGRNAPCSNGDSTTGGTGDVGRGGTTGLAGTEWDATHGAGGGGAGGGNGATGANGGNYGAGGGGGGTITNSGGAAGGVGGPGLIVITYYPQNGTGTLAQCSDGIDNNGNGLVDTLDICACRSPYDAYESVDLALCPTMTECSNGIDDNSNGLIDTADTCACSSALDTTETYDSLLCTTQCSDGIDNDGDTLTDMADTCACSSPMDNVEAWDDALCSFSGGTVICTELNRQKLIPDAWMSADASFGARMPSLVVDGYHVWARPLVGYMQESSMVTSFVYFFAHPWAQEMAYLEGASTTGSLFGLFEMVIGIPVCWLVGFISAILQF